jgi:formylglycine-generating enzyme required for sulfatase activity
MAGNVWEWTSDEWTDRREPAKSCCSPTMLAGTSSDAPTERFERKVIKGGSHLCSPNYCLRFRPAARQPEAVDTSTCHIGFRCVADAPV